MAQSHGIITKEVKLEPKVCDICEKEEEKSKFMPMKKNHQSKKWKMMYFFECSEWEQETDFRVWFRFVFCDLFHFGQFERGEWAKCRLCLKIQQTCDKW